MRKTELRRKTPLRSKTGVRPVNRKRKVREFSRAYGGADRIAFVASLPCVVDDILSPCAGKIENAHTENGGRGRKADAKTIAPICTKHHDQLHTRGATWFQVRYAVDLKAAAAATELRWQIAQGSA